jgi:hypothetical protein
VESRAWVLVDGDVGCGGHLARFSPLRAARECWSGAGGWQRRKKLVGCPFRGTAHQLLIGADSHHEQCPGIWAKGNDRN